MARFFLDFFGLEFCRGSLIGCDRSKIRRRQARRYSFDFAAEMAASYNRRMIKDRPHRLDLLYINQPLYFVTFATRDRKSIPSLDRAQRALEQHARCGITDFNVALGRYVIMPDHVHLFVRGDKDFTLSSWIGGLKRVISVSLKSSRLWQPGFLIMFSGATKAMRKNGIMSGTIRFGLVLLKVQTIGRTNERLR